MDYRRRYDALVNSRRMRERAPGLERHHVMPRALGGDNSSGNMVNLTPREHFVAHRLLAKIHGGPMWAALAYMARGNTKSARGVVVSSRTYETIKANDAAWRSVRYAGDGNPFKGKTFTPEQLAKMVGPRPSIAGMNHPCFGKKLPERGLVISGVKRHSSGKIIRDSAIQRAIESACSTGNAVLRKMKEFYLRSEAMKSAALDRDYAGEGNPNYGNGQAIAGDKNPMWGKKQTDATKAKIGEKAKRTLTCPHCGKVGNIANMHRWHFDNCRRS